MQSKNPKDNLLTLIKEILFITRLYKNSIIYKLVGFALLMGLVEVFSIAIITPFVK